VANDTRKRPAQAQQERAARLLLSADDLRDLGIRCSRSQMFKMVAEGRFPRPIKISEQRSAWLMSEIEAWLAARVAERDGEAA
jgi:prophage regulatory protein